MMERIDEMVIDGKKYLLLDDDGAFLIVPLADDSIKNHHDVKTTIIRYYAEKRKHPKRGRPRAARLVYRQSPPIAGVSDD